MNESQAPRFYLHIGYQKNASTMLQSDIFPRIPGVEYLGGHYGRPDRFAPPFLEDMFKKISTEDSLNFKAAEFGERLASLEESLKPGKYLMSWEACCGNVADRGQIAARLHGFFPDARVLVIIRNQFEMLRSMYAYVAERSSVSANFSFGNPPVGSFQKWIDFQRNFPARSFVSTLNYCDLIDCYKGLFGEENTVVLFFEDLKKDPAAFFAGLADFLQEGEAPLPDLAERHMTRKNVRPTRQRLIYNRLRYALTGGRNISDRLPPFVRALWSKLMSAGSGKGLEFRLDDETTEWLHGEFSQGNQELLRRGMEKIRHHGYPL